MNAMNAAVTLEQFERFAQQDAAFLGLVQSVKGFAIWWLRLILLVSLGWLVFLLAQFIVPKVFKKHLNQIYPALPYIKDKKSLGWLRDTFELYFFTLKGYRSICWSKREYDMMMDELDEHIDSLDYVLRNEAALNDAVAQIPASR